MACPWKSGQAIALTGNGLISRKGDMETTLCSLSPLAAKRVDYRFPDLLPAWHALEFSPYGGVIEQEQQEEEDAGVCRPAISR